MAFCDIFAYTPPVLAHAEMTINNSSFKQKFSYDNYYIFSYTFHTFSYDWTQQLEIWSLSILCYLALLTYTHQVPPTQIGSYG